VSNLPTPYYQSEKVTLYCGDCLSILPHLSGVDAVVTDPPYGVGNGHSLRKAQTDKNDYAAFDDTEQNVRENVIPAVTAAIGLARNAAVTPGFRMMWEYPRARHVGSFQYPGSTVMSAWGPCLWQPVLYYGSDPHQGQLRPDSFPNCNDVDRDTEHPCPKPIKQWTRLVERASLDTDTILDPFMGSGTTGVAAVRLGRKFIGIEIDEGYCAIAKRRIQEAEQAFALFEPQPQAKQAEMFGGLSQ